MNTIQPAAPDTGAVTLPAEADAEDAVQALFAKWGADAIRDSNSTQLSPGLVALGHRIYSTICPVRVDQGWPQRHPDHLPMKFLMSDPVTATSDIVRVQVLDGYHPEKYRLAGQDEAQGYWDVMDRTMGEPHRAWTLDMEKGEVAITDAVPFHIYTVSFLAYVTWDTTGMYDHLVNQWTGPHIVSTDPYHRAAWDHMLTEYERWLEEKPETNVVRLTTLAYHFNVDFDPDGADKFRDWTGYQETVSLPALRDFEAEYGYRMRAEDFVDQGYGNAVTRVPSPRYRDWMAFIHRFVVKFGRSFTERAHAAGKQTAMFWGDHWIGCEPYSPEFQDMGIDIHIGACEDGVALRRIADAPGNQTKEVRLYPYFFPDVFHEGGDPTGESVANWGRIRRALLRQPIDRIGYGGYLSLASQFPDFVDHVADLCDEFRGLLSITDGTPSHKVPVKVGVLNAWGKLRAWINSFGPQQKFLVKRQDVTITAGTNLLECLAGLPVEVEFLDFDEVQNGALDRVDVLINDGDDGTAWSGGRHWADPTIVEAVRAFIHRGGGFIGCRGPTATPHQGRCFQLSDVLGVERETGQSLQNAAPRPSQAQAHFITADLPAQPDFGCSESFVFATSADTDVLRYRDGHVMLATHGFGEGRSVFLAGLPYDVTNTRLLYRSILWSTGKETCLQEWFSENPKTECAWYPEKQALAVVNNVDTEQSTRVHTCEGEIMEVTLPVYGMQWYR